MNFSSSNSSFSTYSRSESFRERKREKDQIISSRKNDLDCAFQKAMKKIQSPKSEKKKKLPYVYVNNYFIPSTLTTPYVPFDKNLSPAKLFERRWQIKLGILSSADIHPFKYEKIDFSKDFTFSDSDNEKDNQSVNEENEKKEKESDSNDTNNATNNKENNNVNNIKENAIQEANTNENADQENQIDNANLLNHDYSDNSEDLKIEDLDGSNNGLNIEEEEEEVNNSLEANYSTIKNSKVENDQEHNTIASIIIEEESEDDIIDLLNNSKGGYIDEEEEEINENSIKIKNSGSPVTKMSDDANGIFNFSSEYSQGADE